MSIDPGIEPRLDDETFLRVRMEILAESAVVLRPRMFAIHGLAHNPDSPDVLGWGLEFPDGEGAVFTELPDGGVHLSDSAERVLRTMSIIADVRLTWLDPG